MRKLCFIFALCAVTLCAGCAGESRESSGSGAGADSAGGTEVANGAGVADVSSVISETAEESADASIVSTAEISESAETSVSLVDISYAALLPEWEEYFPDGEIKIADSDGGKEYHFYVYGADDEHAKSYREACRELDFKHGPEIWNEEGMNNFLTNPDAEDVGAWQWEKETGWHYEAYSGDKLYVVIMDMNFEKSRFSVWVRYKG